MINKDNCPHAHQCVENCCMTCWMNGFIRRANRGEVKWPEGDDEIFSMENTDEKTKNKI